MDITALLEGSDSKESTASPRQRPEPPTFPSSLQGQPPTTAVAHFPAVASATAYGASPSYPVAGGIPPRQALPAGALQSRPRTIPPLTTTSMATKRGMGPHSAESPAKKQSKWSPEEDALIIELRGSGMKWEDISKQLPGRSAISCRLHYQNYLERRSEWDEERKNKLARLYERYVAHRKILLYVVVSLAATGSEEAILYPTNTLVPRRHSLADYPPPSSRFKPEMWAKVAEEMAVPWRAAEAMHWQLGEAEMARRAGVVPFTLSSAGSNEAGGSRRSSPSRGYTHAHSGSLSRDPARYGRGHMAAPLPGRPIPGRRESVPPRPPPMPPDVADRPPMSELGPHPGLAPIQLPAVPGHGGGMLPGIAELTTGVSPYSTPAYSVGMHSASPVQSAGGSPYLPGGPYYQPAEPSSSSKRPTSPRSSYRDANQRRFTDVRYE